MVNIATSTPASSATIGLPITSSAPLTEDLSSSVRSAMARASMRTTGSRTVATTGPKAGRRRPNGCPRPRPGCPRSPSASRPRPARPGPPSPPAVPPPAPPSAPTVCSCRVGSSAVGDLGVHVPGDDAAQQRTGDDHRGDRDDDPVEQGQPEVGLEGGDRHQRARGAAARARAGPTGRPAPGCPPSSAGTSLRAATSSTTGTSSTTPISKNSGQPDERGRADHRPGQGVATGRGRRSCRRSRRRRPSRRAVRRSWRRWR